MNLAPYSSSDLADFLLGGKTWAEWQSGYMQLGVSARENLWIAPSDLSRLQAAGGAASLSLEGESVATVNAGDGCLGEVLEASSDTLLVEYVWDLLLVNEQIVKGLSHSEIKGEVHSHAVIDGYVKIGEGTRILPGVYIEGNVVIGKNCKIGPNCYLRGSTSIGDQCHIGQSVEIKNTIIGHKTNVGHLSYIGDSILGHFVNLGSGTTTSNLRHDGKSHMSLIDGSLVDTRRRKFGAIIADGTHTGINTSIYPGRKLGKSVTTLPGEVINSDK